MREVTSKVPTVSILMITYNHQAFVEQAVRSVMMQETDFDYELVIGEDCSTDSTREILLRLQEEFPDRMRLLPANPGNIGMMQNFLQTLAECDGDFIAFLDGDDYWNDPHKLQIQVDFLLTHADYVGCFTDYVTTVDGSQPGLRPTPAAATIPERVTLEILVYGNLMVTSTVLCRKLAHPLPGDFVQLPIGDWPLHMLQALQGDFHYIPKQMACYRIHAQNTYATIDTAKKILCEIQVLEFLIELLPHDAHQRLHQKRLMRDKLRLEMQGGHSRQVLYLRFQIARTYKKSPQDWLRSALRSVIRRRHD